MKVSYWSEKHFRNISCVTGSTVTLINFTIIIITLLNFMQFRQLYLVHPILPDLFPDGLDNVREAPELVQDTFIVVNTLQNKKILKSSCSRRVFTSKLFIFLLLTLVAAMILIVLFVGMVLIIKQ